MNYYLPIGTNARAITLEYSNEANRASPPRVLSTNLHSLHVNRLHSYIFHMHNKTFYDAHNIQTFIYVCMHIYTNMLSYCHRNCNKEIFQQQYLCMLIATLADMTADSEAYMHADRHICTACKHNH